MACPCLSCRDAWARAHASAARWARIKRAAMPATAFAVLMLTGFDLQAAGHPLPALGFFCLVGAGALVSFAVGMLS